MWLLDKAHAVFDAGLHYLKLIEDRQVGWLTLDRKSGDFKREQQSLWKKLKLLLLFNPVTEWIDRTHALRLWTHRKNLKAGKCTEPKQRLPVIRNMLKRISQGEKWASYSPMPKLKLSLIFTILTWAASSLRILKAILLLRISSFANSHLMQGRFLRKGIQLKLLLLRIHEQSFTRPLREPGRCGSRGANLQFRT